MSNRTGLIYISVATTVASAAVVALLLHHGYERESGLVIISHFCCLLLLALARDNERTATVYIAANCFLTGCQLGASFCALLVK